MFFLDRSEGSDAEAVAGDEYHALPCYTLNTLSSKPNPTPPVDIYLLASSCSLLWADFVLTAQNKKRPGRRTHHDYMGMFMQCTCMVRSQYSDLRPKQSREVAVSAIVTIISATYYRYCRAASATTSSTKLERRSRSTLLLLGTGLSTYFCRSKRRGFEG